jgi:hypothetical protein
VELTMRELKVSTRDARIYKVRALFETEAGTRWRVREHVHHNGLTYFVVERRLIHHGRFRWYPGSFVDLESAKQCIQKAAGGGA